MPYIDQDTRAVLDPLLRPLLRQHLSPGELNYIITRIISAYCRATDYQTIAEITGVLENAKQEFYRRVAAPYEDKKREKNGDVYNAGS